MFAKVYEVRIKSVEAMDLVNVLGRLGVKFEVSEEYFDELDPQQTWYRDFTILASKRTMEKIKSEVIIDFE